MSPALGEGCSSSRLKSEGEFLTLCTWSCVAIRGDLKGVLNHRAGVDALLTSCPLLFVTYYVVVLNWNFLGQRKQSHQQSSPCWHGYHAWCLFLGPLIHLGCRDWLAYVLGAFLVYSGTLACVSVCERVCDSFLEFMESEGLQGWWVNLKTALYLQKLRSVAGNFRPSSSCESGPLHLPSEWPLAGHGNLGLP